MHEHRREFPVTVMCDTLHVSKSGYYASLTRPTSARSQSNARLVEAIRRIHQASHQIYGSPRIHAQLVQDHMACGRHRVARLMHQQGIQGKVYVRYKRLARIKPPKDVAPNRVNRQFTVPAPNRIWAGDITCFWTGAGWLYLAVILDLYSRKVIGWSMHGRMTETLVLGALEMAVLSRAPVQTLIHHSDQGGQYLSAAFTRKLSEHRITPSMSRRGNCYDNAVVESFFKSLKYEWIKDRAFTTREEARREVFEYIEVFYNRRRLHSTLGYVSPTEYEQRAVSQPSVH